MADPRYPDVPDAKGVPPVLRQPDRATPTPTPGGRQADADAAGQAENTLPSTAWGIFKQDGTPALSADNVVDFEASADFRISDYPLEKGNFETYNKVQMPKENRISLTKGGSLTDRIDFLNTLERIQGDYELYNVVTPEKTYMNVNIVGDSMRRTSQQGATLLTVEIRLREVRQTAIVAFSKSPIPAPPPPPETQATRPPSGKPNTTRAPSGAKSIARGAIAKKPAASNSVGALTKDLRKSGYTVTESNGNVVVDLKGHDRP